MKGLKYPPFAKPAPQGVVRREEDAVEALPPIDDFLDELPSIDDFLEVDAPPVFAESAGVATYDDSIETRQSEEGWAAGSWQSYDWGSVSSLNRASASAVDSDSSWGDSEWPEPPVTNRITSSDHGTTPTADEVADALDGMARRIRTGELIIDNLRGTTPEAAMAAALAVLLRMRG